MSASSDKPSRRFVILHHTAPDGEHWDLMIETGEKLATWRLAENPRKSDNWRTIEAQRIGDHRKAYLDYEGPLSRDRGSVTRVDAGTCELRSTDSAAWRFQAKGAQFRGAFELESTGDKCELRRVTEP